MYFTKNNMRLTTFAANIFNLELYFVTTMNKLFSTVWEFISNSVAGKNGFDPLWFLNSSNFKYVTLPKENFLKKWNFLIF